jgi:hypothetical protein
MSFWGRLFGTPEVVSEGIDAIVNTGDALVFTDEEKSDANMRWWELRLKAAEATQGSRLARRLLALMFCSCFLFWVSVAGVLVVVAAYQCAPVAGVALEYCAAQVASDNIILLVTSTAVGSSVVAIISWYFWSGIKRKEEN